MNLKIPLILFKFYLFLFLLFPQIFSKMCFELKSMGYCDNAVYKAMMQKHCLSECGANACFDKRADLCPYWKQDPNNFCTNSFYSPQTVEEWCNATCNCGNAPPPANNAPQAGGGKKK